MTQTPVSLLERLKQQADADAWSRFVSLYTPLIHDWGRGVGLQDQDAADLVQKVFVILLQVMPNFTYDGSKSFRRWLRTVTLNKWRDRCTEKGAQPPPGTGSPAELDDVADHAGSDPFSRAEFQQHLIQRALQIMKADFQPTTWKACWEHVVSGRPAREIAAELGITPGAVYAARLHVLDRLRQELAGMLE